MYSCKHLRSSMCLTRSWTVSCFMSLLLPFIRPVEKRSGCIIYKCNKNSCQFPLPEVSLSGCVPVLVWLVQLMITISILFSFCFTEGFWANCECRGIQQQHPIAACISRCWQDVVGELGTLMGSSVLPGQKFSWNKSKKIGKVKLIASWGKSNGWQEMSKELSQCEGQCLNVSRRLQQE